MPAALRAIYMVAQNEVYTFAVESMLESIYKENDMVPIHTYYNRYCRSTFFSLFSTNLCSHACVMALYCLPIPQTPCTIGCPEFNWDH